MRNHWISMIPGVLILAAAYGWLAGSLNGWIQAFTAPWSLWFVGEIGKRYGFMIWLFVANTSALGLAACPIAIIAMLIFRQRAGLVVACAAITVAIHEAASIIRYSVLAGLSPAVVITDVLDFLKLALLPVLLVWALERGQSNARVASV